MRATGEELPVARFRSMTDEEDRPAPGMMSRTVNAVAFWGSANGQTSIMRTTVERAKMNPLETARKLIALATDPSAEPEEARTAAAQAARIIREHGLLGEPPSSSEDFGRNGSREAQERDERNRAEHARARSTAFDPAWDPFRTKDDGVRAAYGEGWDRIWGTGPTKREPREEG